MRALGGGTDGERIGHIVMRSFSLTFCFLRLQDSHAWAIRCLLSGSTFGRVMVTVQSCHSESIVNPLEAWLLLARGWWRVASDGLGWNVRLTKPFLVRGINAGAGSCCRLGLRLALEADVDDVRKEQSIG